MSETSGDESPYVIGENDNIFDFLPPEQSHYVVTEFLDLPTAFSVFCVCLRWASYREGNLIEKMCRENFNLLTDYKKPEDKDWKWVAQSKLEFTKENFTGIGRRVTPFGIYEGEFVDGKSNGKGIFTWNTQEIYYGDWEGDKCNGYGELVWPCGHKYKGSWKDGKQEGNGVFHFANGDWYDGEWSEGKRHGHGTFVWHNGDRYVGSWYDGLRHGSGKFMWQDGEHYVGDWVRGSREGKGSLYWNDGDRYEGDWKNDQRSGHGVFHWSNGDNYSGTWVDSKQEGQGKLVWCNGNSYEGSWSLGKKSDGVFYEKASGRNFHRSQEEDCLVVDDQYVHPMVAKVLSASKCSYGITGDKCYFQYLYKMRENDGRTHGVCLACYKKCVPHYGMKLLKNKLYYGGNFHCDCGGGNLNVSCLCNQQLGDGSGIEEQEKAQKEHQQG